MVIQVRIPSNSVFCWVGQVELIKKDMISLFFSSGNTSSMRVFSDLVVQPDNKELLLSILKVTKAWSIFSAPF